MQAPARASSRSGCDWVLLAEASRPFGDKWRGVTDVETRYRQREVDLWANERSREVLLLRSRLIERACASDSWAMGFVEVETPILHAIPGGRHARPFVTHHNALDTDLYLRIAPELYLKRLVVGGFEKVFEIGRVFRNEGLSPPQPRVHDARALPGLRRLPRPDGARRGPGGGPRRGRRRHHRVHLPGPRARSHAAVAPRHDGRAREPRPPASPSTCTRRVDELRRGCSRPPEARSSPSWGPGKLLLELYEKTTETDALGPRVRLRLPRRGLAPRATAPARTPSWSSASSRSSPDGSSATPSPSSSTPTTSGAGSRPRPRRAPPATRRRWRSTRTTCGRSSTGCRRPAGSASAIDRLVMLLADVRQHPGGDRLPDAARRALSARHGHRC